MYFITEKLCNYDSKPLNEWDTYRSAIWSSMLVGRQQDHNLVLEFPNLLTAATHENFPELSRAAGFSQSSSNSSSERKQNNYKSSYKATKNFGTHLLRA